MIVADVASEANRTCRIFNCVRMCVLLAQHYEYCLVGRHVVWYMVPMFR